MAGREIWFSEVHSLAVKNGCVHIDLVSGEKDIHLRCSLHTLLKGVEMARRAIQHADKATVLHIPKRKKRGHS
jgi:hypothetical protein